MKKNFNRHPVVMKKVYFRKGKNIISENVNSFRKKYNIHAGIQILPSDYKLIKKNMNLKTNTKWKLLLINSRKTTTIHKKKCFPFAAPVWYV